MSNAESSLATAFDGQRRALELTHRAVAQGLDLQRRAMRSFVDSVDAQRAAGERTTEFVDGALETSLLAMNVTVPGDQAVFEELEHRLDEQRDAIDGIQEASWTALARSMEDGFAAYERFADVYAEAVDASFEAAIEGTGWMRDEVVGLSSRRERAVEIDIEAEEP